MPPHFYRPASEDMAKIEVLKGKNRGGMARTVGERKDRIVYIASYRIFEEITISQHRLFLLHHWYPRSVNAFLICNFLEGD